MTFADFAMTEVRFRKHFRMAPPDPWNEKMLPLHEFLELPEADREDRFPYIWTVDRKNHLSRLLVDEAMVRSCEDRRDFWQILRSLAGIDRKAPPLAEIEAGPLRVDQACQRPLVPAFDVEVRAGEQHRGQHGSADSRRRVGGQPPVTDPGYQRLSFGGAVAGKVLTGQAPFAGLAMVADGRRNFALVKDAGPLCGNKVQRIGKMRNDDGIAGVE